MCREIWSLWCVSPLPILSPKEGRAGTEESSPPVPGSHCCFLPCDFAFLRMSYRWNHTVWRAHSLMLVHLFYCWVAFIIWMYWFCFSAYQLKNTCLISGFEKLCTKNCTHWLIGICGNLTFHFFWHALDFFFIRVRTLNMRSAFLNF